LAEDWAPRSVAFVELFGRDSVHAARKNEILMGRACGGVLNSVFVLRNALFTARSLAHAELRGDARLVVMSDWWLTMR
jgi:hypothetical protein